MFFVSTRDKEDKVTPSQGILKGLADNSGLYVPHRIPKLDISIDRLSDMTYQEVAYEVMKLYFTDFTEDELKSCINNAYDDKFDTKEIAPIVNKDNAFFLELFHGPTIAFKDMALSILPYLMITSARKNDVNDDIVILTATSGDTGKAALAGFAGVDGTKIVVFYPNGGVSRIQELQMVTTKGDNTKVVAVEGNFDDAQTSVKKIFTDKALAEAIGKKGYRFSSANSINIGRLIPQVAYYVYSYSQLVAREEISNGDLINICVPTGNFGNILAGYYAKKMGIPIAKLICASNENKVLYDFFETGIYNKNREFVLTNSPSMDILISSNLERLIHLSCGMDSAQNLELMNDLAWDGSYQITDEMKKNLKDFYGGFASQEETCLKIREMYDKTGYVMDTHTAVAKCVYDKYVNETGDNTKTIIASTASPFKFTRSVMSAIDSKYDSMDDFTLVDELSSIGGLKIPQAIEDIRNADIRHNNKCKIEEMEEAVVSFLQ